MQTFLFALLFSRMIRKMCIFVPLSSLQQVLLPRKLSLPDESKFWGHGISSCAVCDGSCFKKRKIVVIGGGDSAAEEALFLTKFSHVFLIHRRNELTATSVMQKRIRENPEIRILFNTVVESIHPSEMDPACLGGITIQDVLTKQKTFLQIDAMFYGLGLIANSDLFKGQVKMNKEGYIEKGTNLKYPSMTSIERVFVAGDVHDQRYRQAVTACADGAKAAMDLDAFLS